MTHSTKGRVNQKKAKERRGKGCVAVLGKGTDRASRLEAPVSKGRFVKLGEGRGTIIPFKRSDGGNNGCCVT